MLAAVDFFFVHIERTPALLPSPDINLATKVINDGSEEIEFLGGRLEDPCKNGIFVPFDGNDLWADSHLVVDFFYEQVQVFYFHGWGDLGVVEDRRW